MNRYGILNICDFCEHGWRQSHGGCDSEEALYADQFIPERLIKDIKKRQCVMACKNFEESSD